ncbi:type VII secretion protein EssA [Scopulibacillus darangshiensis]|uniref:Type VII secretion protein EssA n=2 Tax=Scopulibacillus darangshiensis TaxID=442528 RepID=A0A4R2PA22_9BACL|nr:type VII secretion protein EssA [Scopulibacillus darangshiensis]
MALLILIPAAVASAETDIEKLKPNVFKDKHVDLNTDYLHDNSRYKQKYAIPEEQKQLTFKKDDKDPLKKVKEVLFNGSKKENNSITAKSAQLHLFSGKPESTLREMNDDKGSTGSSTLMILYLTIIAGGILLLFLLLIPWMMKKQGKGQPTMKRW